MLKDHGIRKPLTAFYKTVSFTRNDLVDLNILRTFINLYLKKSLCFYWTLKSQTAKQKHGKVPSDQVQYCLAMHGR